MCYICIYIKGLLLIEDYIYNDINCEDDEVVKEFVYKSENYYECLMNQCI